VEIKVKIPSRGKTVILEAEHDHGVDSIVEVLCEELGLGESGRWSLVYGGRMVDNSKTLGDLSVRDGDLIEMAEAQTEKLKESQSRPVVKVNVVKPTDAMRAHSGSN
jgi:hypothetical protein